MKLALLGADDESLELVRWAVQHGGHELTAAYDSDDHLAELQALAPPVRRNTSWEELLLGSAADAVIIGRGGKEAAARTGIDFAERRADQLRKLVQARVPLIVVCPACEAIVGFEIEMIRRDVKAAIVPYIPGTAYVSFALSAAPAGAIGSTFKIEQVSLEREQVQRSREAVLFQLARDVTILRQVIGTIQSVSASGPPRPVGHDPLGPKPKELPSLANLHVSLGGESGLNARWSIAPATDENSARLMLIGDREKAVLMIHNDDSFSCRVGNNAPTTGSPLAADAEEVFERLSGALTTGLCDDLWLAVCRDQEAAEAVDRSIARGRTIELYAEEHTEEESFKGVMAMGGCLLLVMAMLVLFLAVIVEGLRLPMRSWPLWRLWPFYLLVPIGAFLLLQLLQLAVKRDPPGSDDIRRLI